MFDKQRNTRSRIRQLFDDACALECQGIAMKTAANFDSERRRSFVFISTCLQLAGECYDVLSLRAPLQVVAESHVLSRRDRGM
jgi:hypothetical protein